MLNYQTLRVFEWENHGLLKMESLDDHLLGSEGAPPLKFFQNRELQEFKTYQVLRGHGAPG